MSYLPALITFPEVNLHGALHRSDGHLNVVLGGSVQVGARYGDECPPGFGPLGGLNHLGDGVLGGVRGESKSRETLKHSSKACAKRHTCTHTRPRGQEQLSRQLVTAEAVRDMGKLVKWLQCNLFESKIPRGRQHLAIGK